MDIEKIWKKWIDDAKMTEEEINTLDASIMAKLENGDYLNYYDFRFIIEMWDYTRGSFVEELRHGWILYEYIIHALNDKDYLFYAAHHDDYGFEDDIEEQICPEAELREVKVKKWVEKEI